MHLLQYFLISKLFLLVCGRSFLYERDSGLGLHEGSGSPNINFRRRESMSEPNADAEPESLVDLNSIIPRTSPSSSRGRLCPSCLKPKTKDLSPRNDGQLHCAKDVVPVRAPNRVYGVYPNMGGAEIMCHQRVKCRKMKVVEKSRDVPKHHVEACIREGECNCVSGIV
ncbi:hypothetical protein MMC10_004002 [Thelotrema lepadinum]|nr:hypothetical protein [Thelotrema lepadinum]